MATSPKVPPGPRGLPLVGCGPMLARDPLGFILQLGHGYGDISSARFGQGVLYLLNHPDLIESLFLGKHRECMKDMTTRELSPLLGQGLLISEGDFWRRQRKLASPPLQPKRIEAYARTMVERTAERAATFRAEEVRDMHADMMELTLEIVGETLLGFDTRRDAERVGHALEDIIRYYEVRLFSLRGLLPQSVPTLAGLRFRRAKAELDTIVYRMIARGRESPDADHLIARLLRARSDSGEAMSDEQARDEAMTMLLAGHETTALALTYALFALSNHPEVERKLREEIEASTDAPSLRDLERMPYLDAVIKETLRLYPPAWAFGREVVQPFSLGGYELPVGVQVLASPYALHRDSRFFPEPTRFMPERWLDGNASELPRYAYVPFGVGPRVCIGSHFAKMEMALVLATLLREVALKVVPGYRLELLPVITMRPRQGVPMIVTRVRPRRTRPLQAQPSLLPPRAAGV
ncbi:MAG TPA: cytochrome P450 [Polyangiales bacterium]|nr:cytochrome P450 [Polyangiales bacterium]